MEDKILRFIELSEEFAKCPEEYSKFPTPSLNISYTGVTAVGYEALTTNPSDLKVPTKLENYKEGLDKAFAKAERWEEYLRLQEDLKTYFKVKLKLDKNE